MLRSIKDTLSLEAYLMVRYGQNYQPRHGEQGISSLSSEKPSQAYERDKRENYLTKIIATFDQIISLPRLWKELRETSPFQSTKGGEAADWERIGI